MRGIPAFLVSLSLLLGILLGLHRWIFVNLVEAGLPRAPVAAVLWALGAGDRAVWRLFVDVASVSRIAITERGPVLRSFNETHHLPSQGSGSSAG